MQIFYANVISCLGHTLVPYNNHRELKVICHFGRDKSWNYNAIYYCPNNYPLIN